MLIKFACLRPGLIICLRTRLTFKNYLGYIYGFGYINKSEGFSFICKMTDLNIMMVQIVLSSDVPHDGFRQKAGFLL